MIYRVMMKMSAAPPTLSGETFGQHAHNRVKIFARKIAKRISAADHFKQSVFSPLFRRNCGYNMLSKNVERLFGTPQAIQVAAAHRGDQCGAFNQLVT